MTSIDPLDELAGLYRADALPPAPLLRAARRGRRLLWAGLLTGLAAAATTSAGGIAVAVHEGDAAGVLFAAIEVGVPLAIMIAWIRSARGAWRAAGACTVDFLRVELERHSHVVRMTLFGRWCLAALAPAMLLWQALFMRMHWASYQGHVGVQAVGIGSAWLVLALVVVASELQGRRARERAARVEATLRDLTAP